MNIAFVNMHPYWGGLANNGGSMSVVAIANELKAIGHNVSIVANSDKMTRIKHDKVVKTIPKKTDVCVAVSASTVDWMLKHKPKRARAAWWMRGMETWQMSKEQIASNARKCVMVVNSDDLCLWLSERGINATVAYQGIDIGNWPHIRNRPALPPQTIGFYISGRKTKGLDTVQKIVSYMGDGRLRYVGFGPKDLSKKDKAWIKERFYLYKREPTKRTMAAIYNMCDAWVCTSVLEGLHNVGMEAAMCGCQLICKNARFSGTKDYAIHSRTAWRYDSNGDAGDLLCRSYDEKMVRRCQSLIADKIGNRTDAANRLVEAIS